MQTHMEWNTIQWFKIITLILSNHQYEKPSKNDPPQDQFHSYMMVCSLISCWSKGPSCIHDMIFQLYSYTIIFQLYSYTILYLYRIVIYIHTSRVLTTLQVFSLTFNSCISMPQFSSYFSRYMGLFPQIFWGFLGMDLTDIIYYYLVV